MRVLLAPPCSDVITQEEHTPARAQAAGSSLLARLANLLVADALAHAGLADVGASTVLPLATGMALTLTLLALRPLRPAGARCGESGALCSAEEVKCVALCGTA